MPIDPTPDCPGDVDIAAVGALLADPGRARMLMALDDGRALPAGLLAGEAGVSASTASSHLRKLLDGGLLAVETHGRHRYYRLADHRAGQLVEALTRLAPARPVRSLCQGTRAHALRQARTCYDHLAGRLGVALMGALIDRGHLVGGDGTFHPDHARHDRRSGHGHDVDYHLAESGHAFLTGLGVVLPTRPVVRYCVDWSEQRHHLSGTIGRALLAHLTEQEWLRRSASDRAVTLSPRARVGLAEHFGIDWPLDTKGRSDPPRALSTQIAHDTEEHVPWRYRRSWSRPPS